MRHAMCEVGKLPSAHVMPPLVRWPFNVGRWAGGQSSAARSSPHHPSVPAAPCGASVPGLTGSLWLPHARDPAACVALSSLRRCLAGAPNRALRVFYKRGRQPPPPLRNIFWVVSMGERALAGSHASKEISLLPSGQSSTASRLAACSRWCVPPHAPPRTPLRHFTSC